MGKLGIIKIFSLFVFTFCYGKDSSIGPVASRCSFGYGATAVGRRANDLNPRPTLIRLFSHMIERVVLTPIRN